MDGEPAAPAADQAGDAEPTPEQLEEATQALLARNATIIHMLIRACCCHCEVKPSRRIDALTH